MKQRRCNFRAPSRRVAPHLFVSEEAPRSTLDRAKVKMGRRVTLSDEGEGWFTGYADVSGTIEEDCSKTPTAAAARRGPLKDISSRTEAASARRRRSGGLNERPLS